MILAIIPAQSMSSRLPGKNMKAMLGKPLIDYTIEYARKCPAIDEIYVSTDSQEIFEYAKGKGVKAIIRPPALCGNIAIADVLRHAINNIPNADKFSRVVALQVDHPDRAIDLADFIKRVVDNDIADAITIEADGIRNGSIRILRIKDLMSGAISYSILAVRDECTNIHYQKDFDCAADNIKKRLGRTDG